MILGLALVLMLQTPPAAPANDHEYSDLVRIKASDIYNKYVSSHAASEADKKELKELFQFQDFVGKAMDGRVVNFHLPKEAGYKPAKVLILTYVAEWCQNCKYEAPYLRELYLKHKGKGLEIVARSEYSEVAKMKAVVEQFKTPYPVITGSVIAYDERE